MDTNGIRKEVLKARILNWIGAPLLTAFLAIGGSVGGTLLTQAIQMGQIKTVLEQQTTAIKALTEDISEIRTAQNNLFKDFYLPSKAEWSCNSNDIAVLKSKIDELQKKADRCVQK
jgi:hypothetical protein